MVIVTALSVLATIPKGPDLKLGSKTVPLFIHQGLDLKGGVAITYEADLSKISKDKQADSLDSLKSLVNDRVNRLGVSEPVIQAGKISDTNTLLVELPGVVNVDEAIRKIGEFPKLDFIDEQGGVIISGEDVDHATTTFGDPTQSSNTSSSNLLGAPQVTLKLKDVGKQKFASATTKAAAATPKGSIGIVLDGQLISNPVVQSPITDGTAVISGGGFTVDTAKRLTDQLNQGALPVPVKIISQATIGATLGSESLKKSLVAGLIGFLLVALFMILYYRVPGFLAIIALIIYTLMNITLYKLIPVTMTLAGVAGFILSIGMAVDANILIFERMREELKAGKPAARAIDEGFTRAWTSIRDSNTSTLLTALILFFGTSGLVKGFALTLAIGVLVSLFTAITVTRVLLKLVMITPFKRTIHA